MRRKYQGAGAILLSLIFLLTASTTTTASIGPLWSDAQLADFSDVVLTGSVVEVRSGWDRTVNSIYTYVTVDVDEVWKGILGTDRVTIKQLGGIAGDMGLAVADQPTFEVGEQVLLFLEARPRDGTLYTAALWQGKWSIASGLSGRVATRAEPGQSANVERRDLAALGEAVRAAGPDRDAATSFQTQPQEASIAEPFVLIDPDDPYRYFFSPPVDVQSGGQPGLSGGGFSQIVNSLARWNAVSAFQFAAGSAGIGPRCTSSFLGTSRVTLSFMDPCAEMSNTGGTLAIGGSYYNPNTATVVNGVTFHTALEGFIVNNDSSSALNFLTNSGCFSDIELHELGHVLGLGHSTSNAAIMFASVSFSTCSVNAGGRNLGTDDVAGAQFIYPSGPVPGTPTVTSAVASGGNLTVTWTSGAGAAPTSHRLDFFQGAALVAQLTTGAGTSAVIPLPGGITGTFGVRVTAINGAGSSSPSAILPFTIGGGTPPGQPTVTSAVASGGVLTVAWTSGAGAAPTSHMLDFYQGAVLVAQLPAGAGTSTAIPLPAGVSGTFGVRVTAFSGSLSSPPSNLFTLGSGDGRRDIGPSSCVDYWMVGFQQSGWSRRQSPRRFYL